MPAAIKQTEIFTEQVTVTDSDRKNSEAADRQGTTCKCVSISEHVRTAAQASHLPF